VCGAKRHTQNLGKIMANTLSNWQDAINSQLLGRLVLPLTQAGVMKKDMSQKIIDRSDRFLNRLPLLSQQMQRWGNLNTLSSETVPIVYAQNYAQNIASTAESSNRADQLVSPQVTSSNLPNNLLSSSPNEMPLQAKFASSEGLAADTSSISDRPATKIISDSTMGAMTLQAKFAGSEGLASASSSPLTPSSLTTESITPTISDYPVVTPKASVENFSVTQENLPLKESLAVTSEPLPIAQVKLPNPDLPSSDLPVVNRLNNLINGIDHSPSPSQRDVPQGKIAQSQVYLGDRSPNYVEQINSQITSQILYANSPIVTSVETSAIAESPISPNLAYSQDYNLPVVKPRSTAASHIINVSPTVNVYSDRHLTGNLKDKLNSDSNREPNHFPPLPVVVPSVPNNLPKSPQGYPLVTTSSTSRNSDSRNSATRTDSPQPISEGARELKVFASPSPPTAIVVSSMPNQPQIDAKVDIEAIASQVERKLMRRLVVESERRGHKR